MLFSEDVSTGQMLIGDFVIDPSDGRVAVAVSDAGGIEIYRKSVSSEGRFAHTASRDGEYRMCFANVEGLSQKSVQLSLSSGGRDYKELAKKSNLKPLELELKRLEDTVQLVHQEMKVLKEREMLMREVNGQSARRSTSCLKNASVRTPLIAPLACRCLCPLFRFD